PVVDLGARGVLDGDHGEDAVESVVAGVRPGLHRRDVLYRGVGGDGQAVRVHLGALGNSRRDLVGVRYQHEGWPDRSGSPFSWGRVDDAGLRIVWVRFGNAFGRDARRLHGAAQVEGRIDRARRDDDVLRRPGSA